VLLERGRQRAHVGATRLAAVPGTLLAWQTLRYCGAANSREMPQPAANKQVGSPPFSSGFAIHREDWINPCAGECDSRGVEAIEIWRGLLPAPRAHYRVRARALWSWLRDKGLFSGKLPERVSTGVNHVTTARPSAASARLAGRHYKLLDGTLHSQPALGCECNKRVYEARHVNRTVTKRSFVPLASPNAYRGDRLGPVSRCNDPSGSGRARHGPTEQRTFAEWLRQSESKARQFQRCYFTADPSRSRNGSKAAERCGFHADHSAARIISAKPERSTEVRAGSYFEQAGFYHHRQVLLQPLLAKSGTWDQVPLCERTGGSYEKSIRAARIRRLLRTQRWRSQ